MLINKYIVHVLDKNSDLPILNESEANISLEVDRFLQKVIRKVMKDDNLIKAKFNNFDENTICNCVEQMSYYSDTFLENSKEIAAYLFDIMKINVDLETCDLVICKFTVKDEEYIAILKLDYKKLYTHTIEFIDEKFSVNLITNEIGIPETIKPKYCAIISGSIGKNDEYHLRVLDEQFKKLKEPSKFITEFLDAEIVEDDTYKTKLFKDSADTWIANNLSNDVKKAENIRSLLNYTLKEKEEMQVEEFIEDFEDKDLKESFKEYMETKGLEEGFLVDKKWIEKKLKRRTIKTDTGFEIKGDLSDFEDPMKYSIRQNKDGSIDIVVKNIKCIEN